MSKSQEVAADLAALLRARNPLIWCVSREEARVESYVLEAAAASNYVARTWDVGQGVADMAGNVQRNIGSKDPGETLEAIAERAKGGERGVWIMRDLPQMAAISADM